MFVVSAIMQSHARSAGLSSCVLCMRLHGPFGSGTLEVVLNVMYELAVPLCKVEPVPPMGVHTAAGQLITSRLLSV
jgi:hypothetical protein